MLEIGLPVVTRTVSREDKQQDIQPVAAAGIPDEVAECLAGWMRASLGTRQVGSGHHIGPGHQAKVLGKRLTTAL